jgi:chloramphenicol 3-O-phosphotransferase
MAVVLGADVATPLGWLADALDVVRGCRPWDGGVVLGGDVS